MKVKFRSFVHLFIASVALGSGVGFSHFYLFHLCLLLLLFSWLHICLNGDTGNFYYPKSNLVYFLPLMLLWYVFGLSWSVEPLYTLRYLVYIVLGSSIVFIVVGWITSEERYLEVYNILKWVFSVEIVISLLEIFTSFRLPTSPYSKYAPLFHRGGGDLSNFSDATLKYIHSLPTGFHGNPNNLALLMVTLLPFFLFSKRISVKCVGLFSVFTIIIASGSRGVFFTAIICVVLCFMLLRPRYFIPLSVLAISGLILFSISIDHLKSSDIKKVSEIAHTGDALKAYLFENDDGINSISLRKQLIKNGFDALLQTNMIGVGGGGSQIIQERYGNVRNLRSMHNFWLEILVEAGLVLFILFVSWYLYITVTLLKICLFSKTKFNAYHAKSFFVSFSVFSIGCVSSSSVIYHLPMWLMFGMGLALINLYYFKINTMVN